MHIVLDDVSTHNTPRSSRAPFTLCFHFTPTYNSWTNLVERCFSELTTKWFRRGTHTGVKDLKDSINAWTDNWNQNPRSFVWRTAADDILETMASFLQRIPHSGH